MQTPPVMTLKSPPSWWDRNWKWFLPTLVIAIMVISVGFIATLVYLVFGFIKKSEPYQAGLALARENPALIEAIGEPLEPGWFSTGNIHYSGTVGYADISIPIKGPKGSATVYVEAVRKLGNWEIKRAAVNIDGNGERLLLQKSE